MVSPVGPKVLLSNRDTPSEEMTNYLVVAERRQPEPPQRLAIVARSRENAILTALELVPSAVSARVLVEGQW